MDNWSLPNVSWLTGVPMRTLILADAFLLIAERIVITAEPFDFNAVSLPLLSTETTLGLLEAKTSALFFLLFGLTVTLVLRVNGVPFLRINVEAFGLVTVTFVTLAFFALMMGAGDVPIEFTMRTAPSVDASSLITFFIKYDLLNFFAHVLRI
jgi:hypothetical protein